MTSSENISSDDRFVLGQLLHALRGEAHAHGAFASNSSEISAKARQAEEWAGALENLLVGERDLSDCAYFRGVGICTHGCMEEPECQTCIPAEGWPSMRAIGPAAKVISEALTANQAPGEIAEMLWEKDLLHPNYPR